MSLDYNATKCKPEVWNENATEEARLKTAYLCFPMMFARIGEITEKNVEEVADRIMVVQALLGPFLRSSEGPILYTRQDIADRVGYRTNIPTKWRSSFVRWVGAKVMDNVKGGSHIEHCEVRLSVEKGEEVAA